MLENIFVYTDGGARGNPGPAAIGVFVTDSNGEEIVKFGKRIGVTTNNVAEYLAVIEALKWIRDYFKRERGGAMPAARQIKLMLDSKLIVNQLNGLFRIKKNHLRELIIKIRNLEQEVGGSVSYHFIPREKNKIADRIVNTCFNVFGQK